MEEVIIDEGVPEQNERVDFFLNFGLDAPETAPMPAATKKKKTTAKKAKD
tara:strand:+ start:2227 stop:2376 length:150 start_codon:yes stop_codon:yes gene_type:complete